MKPTQMMRVKSHVDFMVSRYEILLISLWEAVENGGE